ACRLWIVGWRPAPFPSLEGSGVGSLFSVQSSTQVFSISDLSIGPPAAPSDYRYHFRHTCRPVFRFGLHFLFGAVLLGGVLMLVTSGPSGRAPLPVAVGFLLVGIYWFAVRPFE